MAVITNYATLTQGITDFIHRADLAAGLYTDYFIQGAQEKIQDDIFTENWGNGIAYMENAYPATPIENGTCPVPDDWLAPKNFTVSDGSSDVFTLIWKTPAWIFDVYPIRQPEGLPAYIARGVTQVPTAGVGYGNYLAFTATAGQTTFSLAGSPQSPLIFVSLSGDILVPGTDYVITNGNLVLGFGALVGQTVLLQFGPFTSNTSQFIFGPYPDSNYNVQGVYYQKAPLLSSQNPTNWMVLEAPTLLHAACMIKAGEFLLDDGLIQRWTGQYGPRLMALLNRDKAERWGSSTMQIETG